MKKIFFTVSLLCLCALAVAQAPAAEMAEVADTVPESVQELNEIQISAPAGFVPKSESSVPVSTMNEEQLQRSASSNVVDAVSQIPGVSQLTTGAGISKPIIRGLGYNRVVVLHDGVRQEGQQWGDEHGLEVDAHQVGAVEVVKGPSSLMYGSDAMAGVLILHPEKILPSGKYAVDAHAGYQTNNGLVDYSLRTAGHRNKWFWDARFSNQFAHAYRNAYDGYVPGSQFSQYAVRAMGGTGRSWGYSRLMASYYRQKPGIVEGERDELTGELLYEGKVRTYCNTLPFQLIDHAKVVSDNLFYLPQGEMKAIVGYQQNNRREYEDDEQECELFLKQHTVTYDLRYVSPLFSDWRLVGGINGMWQQSLNLGEESVIPDYSLFDFGVYATIVKNWEKWTLNGGVRYDLRCLDFHNRWFNSVSGSVGVVWRPTGWMAVKLNGARGFRAPNMSELGADGVHEGTLRYEIGNPDLLPEYSWQADFGWDVHSKYVDAELSMFANRLSNYIYSVRTTEVMLPEYPTYRYTQGNARLMGFEVGLDIHPLSGLHLINQFSYVDGRRLDTGDSVVYLPMMPAPRWNLELKYEFDPKGTCLKKTWFSVGCDYWLPKTNVYGQDQTETATPDYGLLRVALGTDFQVKGKTILSLFLIGDNLLNKCYQDHMSRLKYADVNQLTGRTGVFNMGRNFEVKVTVPLRF